MTDWEILNIEPTEDKDQIKAAYYRALPHYHPEEDPEGFARLRESYERLMREEPKNNESEIDDTPTGRWMEQVEEAYEDFGQRIRPETWATLLKDDVCFALDSAEEASDKLLAYFMDHCYVPHECLAVLEEHFNWEEKKKDLYNKFPTDFVDYILANSKYEDHFRYPLFKSPEPGKDYDKFLASYFRMQNLIEAGRMDEAKETYESIEQLGIHHPDYSILQIRFALIQEDFIRAKLLCDELMAWQPDEPTTWYSVSRYLMAVDEPEAAVPLYLKILEVNSEHVGALVGMGDAARLLDMAEAKKETSERLKEEGKEVPEDLVEYLRAPARDSLETALDYYKKAALILPYDNYIHNCIHSVSVNLAEYFKQDCEEKPEDVDLILRCAHILEETGRYDEGKECLEKVPQQDRYKEEYLLLMGDVEKGREEWDDAFQWYDRAVKLPELSENTSLAYANMGVCRMEQERFQEALDLYEKGLALSPDNLKLMYRKAAALNRLTRYKEALEVCDLALEEVSLPNIWHYKAEALYFMGEYGPALDACEQAIAIVPYLDTYLIKIKIYYGAEQYEQVLDIIEQMKALEVVDSEVMLFAMRSLRMLDRYEEARAVAAEIMENDPDNAEVYYQMGFLEWDEGNLDQAMELAEKSFQMTPEMTFKRYFMADIHKRSGRNREAMRIYESMLCQNSEDDFVCCKIAELYNSLEEYAKAEEYYRKALEINPDCEGIHSELAAVHESMDEYELALEEIELQLKLAQSERYFVQKGVILLNMNREEEAMDTLEQALRINPRSSVTFNMIGYAHKKNGRLEEAIPYFEKGIEGDDPYPAIYLNLADCLDDKDEYEKEEQVLSEGIEKFPQNSGLYSKRADLYRDTKQYDKMIEDSKIYSKLAEDEMYLYLQSGDAYYLMKDHDEEAIAWYEKGIAMNNQDWRPLNGIGRIYLDHIKDYKKAVLFLEKANNIRSDRLGLLSTLTRACYELGDKHKVKKYANALINLALKKLEDNPDNAAQLYDYIGHAYTLMGKYDKAKTYLERAIATPVCSSCNTQRCHEAFYDLGALFEKWGKKEEALECYRQALEECEDEDKYKEAIEHLTIKKF